MSAVDGVRRDRAAVARLLVSLARNVSTEAAMSTLSSDTEGERPTVNRRRRLRIEENNPWPNTLDAALPRSSSFNNIDTSSLNNSDLS